MSNLHAGDIKPTSDDYLDKFIDLRAQVFEYLNFDFGVDKQYINGEPRISRYDKNRANAAGDHPAALEAAG